MFAQVRSFSFDRACEMDSVKFSCLFNKISEIFVRCHCLQFCSKAIRIVNLK